jgi:hypothetical protein
MADWGAAGAGAASGAAMGAAAGPYGVAIGAVAGGLIGLLSSAKDRGASDAELAEIVRQYQALPLPVQERITAEQQGPSAMEQVSTDPSLRAAQYDALNRLGDVVSKGGMTLDNRANLALGQDEAAQQGMAQRQSIQNNMQARGTANAGTNVAMQMGAISGAEDRASQVGLGAARDAQRAALDALSKQGQLSGNMESSQFDMNARRAQARDLISQYNANARSKAQYYNAEAGQRDFNNRLAKLQGMQGANTADAAHHDARAAQTQSMMTNLGRGTGQILGTALSKPGQTDTTGDTDSSLYVPNSPAQTGTDSAPPYDETPYPQRQPQKNWWEE